MRSVRAALQLIPKNLKNKLKQNERLTGLYVRSVRKSGLFFDAPTPKQTQALYNYWLEVNESTFSKSAATLGEWQAVIFGSDPQGVTKKNIKDLGAKAWVITGEVDISALQRKISLLDDQLPTLLLNGGDLLEKSAIHHLFEALKNNDLVYCDTDELDENGTKKSPRFLPSWNPELQYSTAYINSGVMLKTSLLKLIQISNETTIAELITELSLTNENLAIKHLPLPLMHLSITEDNGVNTLKRVKKVIETHTSTVVDLDEKFNVNRLCWPNSNPLVSLIIPTKTEKSWLKRVSNQF